MDSTDKLFDKIELLASIKGAGAAKRKEEVIRTFTQGERDIVRYALDPTISFFIAKLPPCTRVGTDEWSPAELSLLGSLSERAITGNAALEQVDFSLRELTLKSQELLRRVILKNLQFNTGTTAFNKVFPGMITDLPYMRCSLPKDSKIEQWDWSQGVFSQLKANGSFGRLGIEHEGEVTLTTRQGNVYPKSVAIDSLRVQASQVFQWNTETHGELTVCKDGNVMGRADGNGMLNSLLQGGELDPGYEVRFDVWDQIPLSAAMPKGEVKVPYSVRYRALSALLGLRAPRLISAIETRVVFSLEEAHAHYREILAKGLEGTVVKHPQAFWRDGDSRDQCKLKLEVDVDLKIVGFREGTEGTRTADTFGSVIVQTIDGLLETAVSGFKRDMEQYLHENRDSVLGKIMCVRANEVSPPSDSNELHSLFHPRFVELRDDKHEADTLQQVKDQFESAVAA